MARHHVVNRINRQKGKRFSGTAASRSTLISNCPDYKVGDKVNVPNGCPGGACYRINSSPKRRVGFLQWLYEATPIK